LTKNTNQKDYVIKSYSKSARVYDRSVRLFNLFAPFGFNIPTWREAAVQMLSLKPGDTVVDIGCGTGLNFPLLEETIGPQGKIIAIDLSEAMLEQAQARIVQNGWQNVEIVHTDAAYFDFPSQLDAVLSTFALILIPECGQVVRKGCRALAPGGRMAVLDMAWPRGWPVNWQHFFFFLRSYGVTRETIERRSWETVWATMAEQLNDVARRKYWMGFFYLNAGEKSRQ
jgi:demethylmenaquinone methyltransferase/2-methoxy-6-polyprenyl-1,4-benzoquinol methylase